MNIVRRARMGLIATSVVLSSAALAQETARPAPWLSAFSVGIPAFEGEAVPLAFTIGGNFTRMRPDALSPDFAVGTMPVALAYGAIGWGARAGLALPMQASANTFIVPSAGLSTIGIMGMGVGEGAMGLNTGIAIVSRSGIRAGVTRHRFWNEAGSAILIEVGFGRIR